MRLTVVGCSGSFPGPDAAASCYLLEAPHGDDVFRLVLDLGNGAFGALQRYIDPLEVDAVALSHLHADHCLDLTAFYVLRKYHPHAPFPPVPVYGPSGTAARLARAYDMPEQPGMTAEFDFHEWAADEPVRLGPFEVSTTRVAHPVETYAIRVTHAGRSLVFSGDTGPCDALVRLADGAEVLLAEASFLESAAHPPDMHMTGRDAAEHATRAGVGRLLLTHIPPWNSRAAVRADAEQAFAGPLELVKPGASYEV